ncbi:MAG TPA: hypothetical protein VGU20_30905 [Stellaceae bacterium]|nr:hypothetical protein [Terriglobia bacterium]HEV2551760.1 hypothetical protein [Stellaceae bacterium]
MNKLSEALHHLGVAIEALSIAVNDEAPAGGSVEAPKPRGRGRPPKSPEAAPAAPAPAPEAVEADPFAAPVAAAAPPTATLDEVRAALTALKAATSQEIALGVLKSAGGADNLTSLAAAKYGAVVAAAKKALPPAASAVESDPFAVSETQAPAKALTLEDVKAAVVAAQKRTGTDIVQKVVMEHGGRAANPETGAPAPSLKALPPEKFATVIAAIQALPTTK